MDLPDKHLINDELIEDTLRQIVKDLRLPELKLPGIHTSETPFEQLFNLVKPEVEKLMNTELQSLPQVLYQVDLHESHVNEALASDKPAELLTVAIIKRCFQKVVIRRMYNTGNK